MDKLTKDQALKKLKELNSALKNYDILARGYVAKNMELKIELQAATEALEQIKKDDTDPKTGKMGASAERADKALKELLDFWNKKAGEPSVSVTSSTKNP